MSGPFFSVGSWASAGVDPDGLEWVHVDPVTGWDDPPDARNSFTARAGSSGSFDADVFDDVRTITWQGRVYATDELSVELAKRKIQTVARALKVGADLVGHMPDGDYTVHAKRSPGWKVAAAGLVVTYQAQVVCPDPYKYGAPSSQDTGLPALGSGGLGFPLFGSTGKLEFGTPGVSGRVTLTNPGTEDAWPLFTVTGPVLGGLSITDVGTGRRIHYAGDVPDGANLLIIDSAAGEAQLNGSDRTALLDVAQWFPVPAQGAGASVDALVIDDVYVVRRDETVVLWSPDLLDEGDGVALLTASSELPSLTVQFSTDGPIGQAGTLTATVFPTYQ